MQHFISQRMKFARVWLNKAKRKAIRRFMRSTIPLAISRISRLLQEFEDPYLHQWIPKYLQPKTREALMNELRTRPGPWEVKRGYLYMLDYDPYHLDSVKISIKVGRSKDVRGRVKQWQSRCYRGLVHLGTYPTTEGAPSQQMTLLEKLVHLELQDISRTKVYLDPLWPNPLSPSLEERGGVSARELCTYCRIVHKEVFQFAHSTDLNIPKITWEHVVLPIAERWASFIDAHYQDY
ncbi:hypothetical protein HGRIS_008666 [Hohenbuehelia grisea]|uniref:Bacteriophage T5 Orf172 DNA-binding domain-containing protein n=1 Tax=Hohenbuehelia grisea TaxID=104357 RepID=A0ABR3J8X2_9AGAR